MIINVSVNTIDCLKLFCILILLTFFSNPSEGQEVWTINQYLDFGSDKIELPYEQNLDFLNHKAKGMPFVDNFEFRTESDEMDFQRQQFQFRFEFNSRDERKAYDRILVANKERYSWLQAQHELEIWEEKYNTIIDLFFLQKEMKLILQESVLLFDKKTVLKKLLDSRAQINVEDWIGNESEIFNVRLDSIELELQKKEIALKIFGTERLLPVLDGFNFVQIESIKNRVSSLAIKEIYHPEKEMAKAEKSLADAEYQLEVAEGRKWLNFAQIEYQSDDKVSFQKEIALGTSITIPSKRNNRIKKNNAALELLEKAYKSNLKEDENKKELLFEEAKLMSLIEQLSEFKQLRADQKLDSIFEDFSKQKIVSPMVLISIKRSIVKNEKKQLNLEKDIYETYINYLSLKAAFLIKPTINYLSE